MESPNSEIAPAGRIILLGSVFIVAACALVYELVAGAVSSYILGDAVTQFSLVIGVFLCAMGLGSFLAKFITERLLEIFIELEIWIGLAGGCSSIAMFAVSVFADTIFTVFFYSLCALLGILIGIEIPLLIRILKEGQGFSDALSHVLALDYVGALVGSVMFPLVVLPYLGLSRSSIVFGLMNLIVAAAGTKLLPGSKRGALIFRVTLAFCLLFAALVFSTRLVGFLEDLLYQDDIIYTETTPYQRIVLTQWRDDVRLYLNGHIQFCSLDEARYHESLVIPAMEASPGVQDVLILGGGDGMAAREALKYSSVQRIVLVDIDPAMTNLGKTRQELVILNNDSLNSPKVQIINTDAILYVEESREFFDVIIIDLPDPSTDTLAKLYSDSFYALCARRLKMGGVLATQATSPFFAPEAFWCIVKTIAEAIPDNPDLTGLFPVPYHVNVPSFGEWGFVMASKRRIDPAKLALSVPTRFLNQETLHAIFAFSPDMQIEENTLDINRLEHPVLFEYYQSGWEAFNW